MAEIQNERDKILQAAAIRFILPDIDPGRIPGLDDAMNNANNAFEASKNIRIRATSAVFKVGIGGTTTPTSILLEALLSSSLSGTVTWTVTNGTATLTGSGNSRVLTPSNMTSFTATIRATLTSNGRTFYDEWTITKVSDGASGADAPVSFKSTAFLRSNTTPAPPTGGTFAIPIPTGWSDGVPAGDAKLWATTRIFTATGVPPQQATWTVPHAMTDTASFEVKYSSMAASTGDPTTNPTKWSEVANVFTVWMATRTQKNGVWSSWQVSKIKGETGDRGSNGATGAAGSRGSGTAFGVMTGLLRQNRGSRAKWVTSSSSTAGDTAATNVISSRFGLPLVHGDTVTLTNSSGSPTVSITGYWNGAQWTDPGVIIDGNLLVSGDISGQTFTGGTFKGTSFEAFTSSNPSRIVIDYGTTSVGTRLPKFEVFNQSGQKTSHISPGVNSFSSGNTEPAIDVYNGFTGTSNHAHGVRAEAERGVGVSGRSAMNHGGYFVTHSSNSSGVIALGDKARNGTTNILSDGIHAIGGRYGGVFSGGYAPLRLGEGYSNSALDGSIMFHNDHLWLKSNGAWKALAFTD